MAEHVEYFYAVGDPNVRVFCPDDEGPCATTPECTPEGGCFICPGQTPIIRRIGTEAIVGDDQVAGETDA